MVSEVPEGERDGNSEELVVVAQPDGRWNRHHGSAGFTIRAVITGVIVGIIMCFSNMFFGLRTGWVTMGSLQSALLGYGAFSSRCCHRGRPLNPAENVMIQTVSVAVATMPLAAGFVGIIPALTLMDEPVSLNAGTMIVWSLGIAFFGVFLAVPLRKHLVSC